jgi:hypothetical protein
MLAWLAQHFGPQFVLPTMATMEQVDSHGYAAQAAARGTTLPMQERSHTRLLRSGLLAARWRNSGAATGPPVGMPSGQPCWGPTMACYPISAWSWASPVLRPPGTPS